MHLVNVSVLIKLTRKMRNILLGYIVMELFYLMVDNWCMFKVSPFHIRRLLNIEGINVPLT